MQRFLFHVLFLCGLSFSHLLNVGHSLAIDHFVTLAGGYEPRGNQASLEANVLFFREVLIQSHDKARSETTFFADGYDRTPDLQVAVENREGPLADFLSRLHDRGGPPVEYRNHRIENLAGPLRAQDIQGSLRHLATNLQSGDRVIIYVTAHGEPAEDEGSYNTFISCWNKQRFSAKEFISWLNELPEQVPVILVMAQCYCGGFSHAIFQDLDPLQGLAPHLRCGFFAQQYDLPAAGCRPDIKNDEEYSSYFWGAFVGRSRSGTPLIDVDCNGDGRISFAEAHAQAIIACDSIDIPLRTSEALLRYYSRIRGYEHRGASRVQQQQNSDSSGSLYAMQGTVAELIATAQPDVQASVKGICKQLNLNVHVDVTQVFESFSRFSDELSQVRRQANRLRRSRIAGRREFRDAIAGQWPDLADRQRWRSSPLLATGRQVETLANIAELPGYAELAKTLAERSEMRVRLDDLEIRGVKYERLIGLLETQVLARNLPFVAPHAVERYRQIVALEEGTW
jgi:hypothetical protein